MTGRTEANKTGQERRKEEKGKTCGQSPDRLGGQPPPLQGHAPQQPAPPTPGSDAPPVPPTPPSRLPLLRPRLRLRARAGGGAAGSFDVAVASGAEVCAPRACEEPARGGAAREQEPEPEPERPAARAAGAGPAVAGSAGPDVRPRTAGWAPRERARGGLAGAGPVLLAAGAAVRLGPAAVGEGASLAPSLGAEPVRVCGRPPAPPVGAASGLGSGYTGALSGLGVGKMHRGDVCGLGTGPQGRVVQTARGPRPGPRAEPLGVGCPASLPVAPCPSRELTQLR